MARRPSPSIKLRTSRDAIKSLGPELTANQIQKITGWSRATFYRRAERADFPRSQKAIRGRSVWESLEILEWISRFNLEAIMDRASFQQFERDLVDQAFANPALREPEGRIAARETERRKRLREGY